MMHPFLIFLMFLYELLAMPNKSNANVEQFTRRIPKKAKQIYILRESYVSGVNIFYINK